MVWAGWVAGWEFLVFVLVHMCGCLLWHPGPKSLVLSLSLSEQMATCKIISPNVRDLNCKVKHALVFIYIKQHNPDIIILQETNLRGQKVLALKRPGIGLGYQSVYSNYARGVSVLVARALPFQLENLHIDQSAGYDIIHALLTGKE